MAEKQGSDEKEKPAGAKPGMFPGLRELAAKKKHIADMAAMSSQEIDDEIKKRQDAITEYIENRDLAERERKLTTENNPLKNLTVKDYKRLVEEGIINQDDMEALIDIDEAIKLWQKKSGGLTPKELAELDENLGIQNDNQKEIEGGMKAKQAEIDAQRIQKLEKINASMTSHLEKMEAIVKNIENNPKVIDRLQDIAAKEMADWDEKKKAEKKETLDTASKYVQSLSKRQENAVSRMGQLLGRPNLEADFEKLQNQLSEAQKESDKARALVQKKIDDGNNTIRGLLRTKIVEGEGKEQLQSLSEVAPWELSVEYDKYLNYLRNNVEKAKLEGYAKAGDEKAKKLLESIKEINKVDNVLRGVIGKRDERDNKGRKIGLTPLYAAINLRAYNDDKGITKKNKEEREKRAKEREEFEKKMAELEARGGFRTNETFTKKDKAGIERVVESHKIGVRLERAVSQKGNPLWKVVEVVGGVGSIKVGKDSPLDMSSFPGWLQDYAQKNFIKQGKDYTGPKPLPGTGSTVAA